MYSIYIFKKSNVALNEYVLSVLLQAGFTVGYLVSAPIMGHVGRRSQYFASSIFMATSMLLLAGALRALVCYGITAPTAAMPTPMKTLYCFFRILAIPSMSTLLRSSFPSPSSPDRSPTESASALCCTR